MTPIKPHAYAELPQEFYNLQNWEGFKNPLLVIENTQLKQELGFNNIEKQKLLELKLFVFENKALISLNKFDLMILEFYFKIRFFKIYFKGMNSFFKFLFIR